METRVLIVAPERTTFVVRDIGILSQDFRVNFARNPARMRLGSIPAMLAFPWKVIRSDVVISWYADSSKIPVGLARALGRKSVVIIAGYDVAMLPDIGYGTLLSERNRKWTEWALTRADAVIAVDPGLVEDLKRNLNQDFGAVVIPTGYDPEVYRPEGDKKPVVLSVCSASDRRGLVKGIDVFAECARKASDLSFRLIGVSGRALELLGNVPENLEIIGPLPAEKVIRHYQEAKVYCQLSRREGLPNALCEAMLCGCVAVGSNVQGVRTAIGSHGFLVPYGDVDRTCEAIRKAMAADDLGGREWIIANFSEDRRRQGLGDLLRALFSEKDAKDDGASRPTGDETGR